jgi:hypothetical protein
MILHTQKKYSEEETLLRTGLASAEQVKRAEASLRNLEKFKEAAKAPGGLPPWLEKERVRAEEAEKRLDFEAAKRRLPLAQCLHDQHKDEEAAAQAAEALRAFKTQGDRREIEQATHLLNSIKAKEAKDAAATGGSSAPATGR